MTQKTGPAELIRPCRPSITPAGLPHRGELILQRERVVYPLMINRLMGRGKRSPEGAAEKLTMELFERAFAERDGVILPAAAYLAGRCQPDAAEDRESLTRHLRELLDALPVEDLDVMGPSYIEAAMSLALRGDPESGHRALVPLVNEYAHTIMRSYLAAFYLAQLGDPSGYPALLAALNDKDAHTRLMAVRHLIGFKPFDGETVGDQVVDIRAELVRRLRDRSAYVRVEVPFLLAEAEVKGLQELLRPVAKRDLKKKVRRAARDVLAYLKEV